MRLCRLLTLLLIVFIVACGEDKIETNMSEQVADFEFTTQEMDPMSLTDLEGTWWIADFMYTNCTIVCPTMTKNMANIQAKLIENDLEVQIVSFTVDPNYDRPEVLKEYAKSYEVDLGTWSFLTGYSFETIKKLAKNSFKTVIQEGSPDNPNDLTAHGTSFFLVNPDGKIIKKYDGMGPSEADNIINDLLNVF